MTSIVRANRFIITLAVLVCLNCSVSICTSQTPQTPIEPAFSRDVRPILSAHCYACHGPDEETRDGGFRLDVAGQADLDAVLDRISATDPELVMPPPATNKPLKANDRKTLARWIEQGAEYQRHWAFVAPVQPLVPPGVHPVDYFIDQRLLAEGLHRSERTDPATLIRRVYLDLVGLPPTEDQAATFIANPTDAAYIAIVNDLLASPQYGEHVATAWLDLARYADTNGYEKDRDRCVWPYRDWVIRAFNSDMPFDEFTIAQIAGDMLPDATVDQRIATGFHRNTMLNEEGGIDPLEYRFHSLTDRVATTGTAWLGLTIGCAQCHTHKYDPITHHDYYSMIAYFNNSDEPSFTIPDIQVQNQYADRLRQADELLDNLPENKVYQESFARWLLTQREHTTHWSTLKAESLSANVPYLTREGDDVIVAAGDTSKHDVYTMTFPASQTPITALQLEVLPDERLPGGGPGLTYYEGQKGDFYLTEFEVMFTADGATANKMKFAGASETYAKNGFGSNAATAAMAIDDDIQTGWSVADRIGQRHVAVFTFAEPLPLNMAFTIEMHFGRHFASSLGKFRLSATSNINPAPASTLMPATKIAVEKLLPELQDNTDASSFATDPLDSLTLRDLRRAFLLETPELATEAQKYLKLVTGNDATQTLVMQERPRDHSRATFIHHRGEYTQPEAEVQVGLPEVLVSKDTSIPTNRLEFARWLVSRDNPLTARVVVNRQWAALFGTGIVSTLDDFGMQGSSPTHPELLDYLAVDFMQQQWSSKSLLKLLVTSETYKQASAVTIDNTHTQSEELLNCFPRLRLSAEVIRDAALRASGLLNEEMYGPPVRPPQPAAARSANYAQSEWLASLGADRYRRSVYTYQKRTAPFAMLTTFDAGSRESCLARRDRSDTPLQALTLLNDPMFVEIAQKFGERMAAVVGDDKARLTAGFGWLMTRAPSDEEVKLLLEFYNQHRDWAALARVLLCLDEAITKN